MSDNAVHSKGTLKIANGRTYRGILTADEKEVAFYTNTAKPPVISFDYHHLSKVENVRRGGVASALSITLTGGESYAFELKHGLKMHSCIESHWEDRPVVALTRGETLRRQSELRGETIVKRRRRLFRRRNPNRSLAGDFGIYLLLLIVACLMGFPLVFAIGSSLKPLDELFRFPPTLFPQHITFDNFSDLIVTMGQSWVPFSRYLTNTVFLTIAGTVLHLIIASMAAFMLAKYDFPGHKVIFGVIVTALMFSGYVTGIPNYVIMSRLKMIDSYWALILPAIASPLGLFLMKQFMEGLPTALIEAAKIDGAGEFCIFLRIVMPNVKPAWLTVIIFSIQSLWNTSASTVIYSEAKKPLVYALQQIQGGGIARTGQAAAVTVVVMSVPILAFIINQSQILETMATSGLKD